MILKSKIKQCLIMSFLKRTFKLIKVIQKEEIYSLNVQYKK